MTEPNVKGFDTVRSDLAVTDPGSADAMVVGEPGSGGARVSEPPGSMPGSGSDEGGPDEGRPRVVVQDRRFWARGADGGAAGRETDRSPFPSFVEELKHRTETAEKKLKEKVAWLEQEAREVRERLERDRERRLLTEKASFLQDFLAIPDDLDRALQAASDGGDARSLMQGIVLIRGRMAEVLERAGAAKLDIKGRPFDPMLCEAVATRPVDSAELDGIVLEEIASGFMLGDRLLRAARVIVGRYEGAGGGSASDEEKGREPERE